MSVSGLYWWYQQEQGLSGWMRITMDHLCPKGVQKWLTFVQGKRRCRWGQLKGQLKAKPSTTMVNLGEEVEELTGRGGVWRGLRSGHINGGLVRVRVRRGCEGKWTWHRLMQQKEQVWRKSVATHVVEVITHHPATLVEDWPPPFGDASRKGNMCRWWHVGSWNGRNVGDGWRRWSGSQIVKCGRTTSGWCKRTGQGQHIQWLDVR